ncbi:MAG: hypothetical protein JSS49_16370 [Planctomycetes bacterium]|nr:hypothetical protein [Planctomycetota bacterium]
MNHVTAFRTWIAVACTSLLMSSIGIAEDVVPPLPLKRVVMLNSGIGYFEHVGKIDGNQQIEFPVKSDDINDLLKSLTVQDRGAGRVTAVNYNSPEPIAETLKSLAIDMTRNPSLAQIIQQLRGQQVEFVTATDANPVTGQVVGVDRRRILAKDQQPVDVEFVLLRTAAGLKSLQVDSITLTKFLDAKTDREFQQALDLLTETRRQDHKSVKLDLRGEGAREVTVGYVQESPVWKTSYRMLLAKQKPPFLQGWAIVENTTAQDWTEVDLTLMSGRPISFQMDLYQPLFAARPMATLELNASVEPRVYNQDLMSREEEFLATGQPGPRRPRVTGGGGGFFGGGGIGGMGGGMGGGGFGMFPGGGSTTAPSPKPPMNLAEGVTAAADGSDVGESFEYKIKTPVTLRRNVSAMLPIINDPIQGTKVYIFNLSVHPKHPLAGLKLTNSTDLHFQQGPVTVFEDDEYAGDAQIADIPPGSTRLITYAMDLDTEIAMTRLPETTTLVGMKIQSGGLILTQRETRQTTYLVKNSGSVSKSLLIEQKLEPAWPKVTPEPAEKTRDLYRFGATAEPGKPTTLTVTQTRDIEERLLLQTMDVARIELSIRLDKASLAVRAGLKELLMRKTELTNLTNKRGMLEGSAQMIASDQSRLRENLRAVDDKVELHQRYIQKLAASEDALEKLRLQITDAVAAEEKSRQNFESFTAGLTAE